MCHGEFGVPFPASGESMYRLLSEYYPQESRRLTEINWHNACDPFPSFDDDFERLCEWEREKRICTSFLCLQSRVMLFLEANPHNIHARVLKACIPPSVSLSVPETIATHPGSAEAQDPTRSLWWRNVRSATLHVQDAKSLYKSSSFALAFQALAKAFFEADAAVNLSRQTMLDLVKHTQFFRQMRHLDAHVVLTSLHLFLRLRRHPNTVFALARHYARSRGPVNYRNDPWELVAAILDVEGDLLAVLGHYSKARTNWEEAQDRSLDPRRSLKLAWEDWKALLYTYRETWDNLPSNSTVDELEERIRSSLETDAVMMEGSALKRDYHILLAIITLQRVSMSETIELTKAAMQAEKECAAALQTTRPIEAEILLELCEDFSRIRDDCWKRLARAKMIAHLRTRTYLSHSALMFSAIDPILLESAAYEMATENLKVLQKRRPPPPYQQRNIPPPPDYASVSTRLSSSSSRQ